MQNCFRIKLIDCDEKSLKDIGFDKTYTKKGTEKHDFQTIKICNLNCAQANIIKQTALSAGTDCAVHREVITGKVEFSDSILSATKSQIRKIAEKLKYQPFKLGVLAEQIKNLVFEHPQPLFIRDIEINWGENTYLMGILNITPDSFSDGGQYLDTDNAIVHYKELLEYGADFVDIGGESTRPFSQKTSVKEEMNRVVPVIQEIRKFDKNTIISIDTRNALTAQAAIREGADIINDISALEWDKEMISVLKETGAPVILNHCKGTPENMQKNTQYTDVVDEIFDYLKSKTDFLLEQGIEKSKIIIDPGIGFGKSTKQNFEILKRIKEFKSLGYPVLVGHSRKNFLKETVDTGDIETLDTATVIVSEYLINEKVDILRVHDIKQHRILRKIRESFI